MPAPSLLSASGSPVRMSMTLAYALLPLLSTVACEGSVTAATPPHEAQVIAATSPTTHIQDPQERRRDGSFLPGSCEDGQFVRWDAVQGLWDCADPPSPTGPRFYHAWYTNGVLQDASPGLTQYDAGGLLTFELDEPLATLARCVWSVEAATLYKAALRTFADEAVLVFADVPVVTSFPGDGQAPAWFEVPEIRVTWICP